MRFCISVICVLVVAAGGNNMERYQNELVRNKRALFCFHYPDCCSVVKNGVDQCAWACPVCPKTQPPPTSATKGADNGDKDEDPKDSSFGLPKPGGGGGGGSSGDPLAAFGIGGVNIFEGEELDVEGFGAPIDYDEYYDDDDDVEGREDYGEDYGDYEPEERVDRNINNKNIDMMMKKLGIYNMINNYDPKRHKQAEKASNNYAVDDNLDRYQAPSFSSQYRPHAASQLHKLQQNQQTQRWTQPTQQNQQTQSRTQPTQQTTNPLSQQTNKGRRRPSTEFRHNQQKHSYSLPAVTTREKLYLFGPQDAVRGESQPGHAGTRESQPSTRPEGHVRRESQQTTLQKIANQINGNIKHVTSLLSTVKII